MFVIRNLIPSKSTIHQSQFQVNSKNISIPHNSKSYLWEMSEISCERIRNCRKLIHCLSSRSPLTTIRIYKKENIWRSEQEFHRKSFLFFCHRKNFSILLINFPTFTPGSDEHTEEEKKNFNLLWRMKAFNNRQWRNSRENIGNKSTLLWAKQRIQSSAAQQHREKGSKNFNFFLSKNHLKPR